MGSSALLVNVPDPARFALHKLISSQVRDAAFQAKSSKDLAQSAQVLEVLLEDRRFDVENAGNELRKRGRSWSKALDGALGRLRSNHAVVADATAELIQG